MLAWDRAGLGTLDLKPAAALDIRDRKWLAPLVEASKRHSRGVITGLGALDSGNSGSGWICMYVHKQK